MREHKFENPAVLDDSLASAVVARLEGGIAARGHAFLVVSGGSTPRGLFTRLAQSKLAWDKVTVLLADERWVPPDHEDCNERMVREHLLVGNASEAQLLSLVSDYPDVATNLARVKELLASVGTFDVVILGMGLDGHTASLFPDAPELAEGLATSEDALMTYPGAAPHARITLSYHRLRDTGFGVLHIVGQAKRLVLDDALGQCDSMIHPVLGFVSGENPFEVYYAR